MSSEILYRILYALLTACVVPFILVFIGRFINFIMKSVVGLLMPGFIYNFIMIFLTFPGIIHHELSHAIICFITGAKIEKMNIFKIEKVEDGLYNLGNVQYSNRGGPILSSIQNALSSIAPTVLGLLSVYLLYNYCLSLRTETWYIFAIYYLIICILIHCDMSTADVIGMLRGLPLVVFGLTLIFYIYKIDIISPIINWIYS